MNDPLPESKADLHSVARAVRFGFAAVVLGLSYLNIHFAMRLPGMKTVFEDMLGSSSQLPAATAWVIQGQPVLLGLSIIIPCVAVVMIFAASLTRSIYVCGFLILVVCFQLIFTWQAMSAPLFGIIQKMQG